MSRISSACCDALARPQLLGEAVLELVDGVEFACQLGEFVVGLRQLALLDRLDGDGDLRVLAGMRSGGELGGEDAGLPLLEPDDRLVEAFDQLAGADLVGQPLGLGLGQILAVDGRRQVDGDEVAVLGGAVHAGQRAEARAQVLQLGVDLFVAHLDGVDRQLQRVEVRELELGADVDLGGELEVLAVLLLGDLDVGLADRTQVRGRHRLAVAAGHGVADDLVQHGLAAEAGLEQLARRLAGPEAGQPHLAGQRFEGLVELGFEFSEGHLHVDANPGRAQLLDGALHARAPHNSGWFWSTDGCESG